MVVGKIARALAGRSTTLAATFMTATGLSNENAAFLGLATVALGLAAILAPLVALGMALGALVTVGTAVATTLLARSPLAVKRTIDILALGALVGAALGAAFASVWRLTGTTGAVASSTLGREAGLASFEKTDEPTLGVRVTRDPRGGVAIAEIYPRSRAELLGIRPGDRIEAINGMPTRSLEDVAKRYELALSLNLQRSRATPKLDIVRGGHPIELGGVGETRRRGSASSATRARAARSSTGSSRGARPSDSTSGRATRSRRSTALRRTTTSRSPSRSPARRARRASPSCATGLRSRSAGTSEASARGASPPSGSTSTPGAT